MTITLHQLKDVIYFVTSEHRYKLSTDRLDHFTAEDVSNAANALAAEYPGEVEAIDRYAVRLMEMVV
jgi:hypothetical protein